MLMVISTGGEFTLQLEAIEGKFLDDGHTVVKRTFMTI